MLLVCTSLQAGPPEVRYLDKGEVRIIPGIQHDGGLVEYNTGGSKAVTLSTLDWPPYIGVDLCRQGWVMQLTVALLASRDYHLKVRFRPWIRAVREVELGESDILFPEYYIEPEAPSDILSGTLRRDHLVLSEPIPGGPVALLKRKDFAFQFRGNVQELVGRRIGVVRGYQNTPEFDALLDRGKILALDVMDDLQNVRVLFARRVELIVGDPAVIFYSVAHSGLSPEEKQNISRAIEVVEPVLKNNPLYYAISRRRPEYKTLLSDLNTAIAEFRQSGEMDRIIRETSRDCGLHFSREG